METKMTLGDRMKGYEDSYRIYLPRRLPIIIRLDGCHFSSVTRHFVKPYDKVMAGAMQDTLEELIKDIPGAVFGWTTSDEISILLRNDQTLTTEPWYGNNLQKIVSVSASIASVKFRKAFEEITRDLDSDWHLHKSVVQRAFEGITQKNIDAYSEALNQLILFDTRAFILPPEEVCNYFIWRQKDGYRNAVSGLAQTLYSHKELQGISTADLIIKMREEKNIVFEYQSQAFRNGTSCYREDGKPFIDETTPIFTENRDFIEKWLTNDEE